MRVQLLSCFRCCFDFFAKQFQLLEDKSKLFMIISLSLSTAAVLIDAPLMPVALPTIQKQLHLSNVLAEWVINAYALALASLFLLGGKVADIFGHRRIYCIGITCCILGSLSCGFATAEVHLILSRVLQGIGAGLMIPSSMAILIENSLPQERGRGIGILVSIASIFVSIAPCVGGAVTELVSWRGVFWLNLPLLVLAKILALFYIPKSKKMQESFDFWGFIFFACGFTSMILGLMFSRKGLEFPIPSFLLFILGALMFLLLFDHLKRQVHPFIDYQLFKNSTFSLGNILIFFTQFLIMISVYWIMYFQKGLGFTPIKAGLFSLVSSCPLFFCAPLSGYLCDRYSPRLPCVLGFSMTCSAFLFFCLVQSHLTVAGLVFGLICFGTGISLIMTPLGATTLGYTGSVKIGQAAGIYGTMRNSATPFAVAVFGSMISNITFVKFSRKIAHEMQIPIQEASFYMSLFFREGQIDFNFLSLPLDKSLFFQQVFYDSLKDSMFYCNLLCFIVSFICLLISAFYLPCKTKSKLKAYS